MTAPSPKHLSRLLFVLFAAFIVYGTTIPFDFNVSPAHLAARLHRVNWYPILPGYSNSLFDDVQNVLLFLPFGFLGWTAIRDKAALWKAFALVAMGFSLSLGVESVQILSNDRTPALTDVFFNTLGAALGVLAAISLRSSVHAFSTHGEVRAFAASEAAYPALLFAALVLVGQLAPFDFTLDFGQFKHKIKEILAHPFALGMMSDDLVFAGRQILLTVFLGRLLRQRNKGQAILRAALAGLIAATFALSLEAAQLIVSSRGPTFQDALGLVLGSAAGALLVPIQGWRRRPALAGFCVYFAVLVSVAGKELYPFSFTAWHGTVNLVPFLAEYATTPFLALARFFEDTLSWLPLGFGLAYLLPRRRGIGFGAMVLAMVSALGLEFAQGWIPGRFPDITDVLSAGFGALAGHISLSRGREAFVGYLTAPHDE